MGDSDVNFAPRRLSKPRTIKSSSNLLGEQPTTPSAPHNTSDQDYFGRDAVVVNSHGECRSRSKSRSRIRAYLYGASHDLLQTSSDDDEIHTGIAGAARNVRKRLSRTGSSITPLQSAKASATRLSNSSSSGLLSTHSTDSQGIDPEESAMIVDQIKQRAHHDSLAAQNHVSTPVDEDKHVDSIVAPLRRKSLYTPGIATRNASDILRKPPKQLTDQDYYYDLLRPETSPLSHLAALSVGEDGRSTPCDLHISQLGGLQLGTLRVTNGASSPVPGDRPSDLASRSATPESRTHDEFYTASEGSVTRDGDGDQATPLPPRGGSPLIYESRTEDRMRIANRGASSLDPLPFERDSSNESFPFSRERNDQSARLQRETRSDVGRSEAGTSNESFPFRTESSKSCDVEAMELNSLLALKKEAPNKSFFFGDDARNEVKPFEEERSKEPFPLKMESPKIYRVEGGTYDKPLPAKRDILNEVVPFEGRPSRKSLPSKMRPIKFYSVEGKMSPNGASDIADEYIAELNDSPFAYSSLRDKTDIVPQSQDPAKVTWRSFVNDAEVQQAGNGSGSREDAFRKLNGNNNTQSTWKPECLSVPPFQPSRHRASSGTPHTDSGYCSYASLTGPPGDETCFGTGVDPITSNKATASPQSQAVEETVRSSARSSFRVPIRKLKKQRPKSQPPPVDFITGCHELTDANIPRIPSFIAVRHANRLSQFPLLEHTFPSSQHTTANGALSTAPVHHAPVRFPSPANALEAPLGSYPTTSKPRASTIVVDKNDWCASDLVRSPSWSEYGGGRRRKEQKKLVKEEKATEKRLLKEGKELERRLQKDRIEFERQSKKDEDKQRSARCRSASRGRSSEGQSPHDTLVTIADFGTVTESLGNSPYDIATPSFPNPQIARNWHPHQISTAMPRPKSLFGARTRSQSMFLDMPSVPALAAVDLKAHNLEWARNRQRNQNSSAVRAESFNEREGIPGNVIRPHSATTEVTPPVPALPSAKQVKRREAEIIRSRPHSMIVEAPVPTPSSRETQGQTAITYPPESGTCATPRKTKGSKIVPDLWSNGSLEKKVSKILEESRQAPIAPIGENDKAIPTKYILWKAQSNAWSQRRKSAGEALLRNQFKNVSDGQDAASSTLLCDHNDTTTSLVEAFTSGAFRTFVPTASYLASFPNSLASHPQMAAQQPTSVSNTPDSYHRSTTQETQRYGSDPIVSLPRPSITLSRHENQTPVSTPSGTQTQSFRIPRKRVGSGLSMIRAEIGIGSHHYEGVLV